MPYDCIHFEYPGTPEIARMAISRLAPDGQWMSPCGACLELYEHKWLPDGEPNPHLGEWALRLKSDDRKDRSRCATMDALQLRGRFLPGEPRTVIFFLDSRDATWTLDKPEPMGDILREFYRAVHREVHWILGQRAAQAEAQATTPDKDSAGRPVGRPPFTEEDWQEREKKVEEVLQKAEDKGISEKAASELLGLSYSTYRDWKRVTKK